MFISKFFLTKHSIESREYAMKSMMKNLLNLLLDIAMAGDLLSPRPLDIGR